ncbi:GNAT family N-acetyltransferase [Pseudalkalibacillus hwajinpoensis]|uniref:GNAT family N-acetyltransferase n=1 Tax=Guptibacillus hwajinpoensis TaxID=208199 RepID=UPI00325AC0BF
MKNVSYGKMIDLKDSLRIDSEVIGNNSRNEEIRAAIVEQRCLVYKMNGKNAGFLIFHTSFFDNAFISLVVVSPTDRRKGVARSLMRNFEELSPTDKIFSSTNQSNEVMQHLFHSLGYVECGSIDHLDEGDPEIIYFKGITTRIKRGGD